MKRPPPPLNHVRSFEAAARHLSFTKAAQELGYTQAAVSTHVRALEHYVGRALFIRNARSLELTESGEAYLPTLRQGLSQIDSATDAITQSAREQSVVVSCPTSLAQIWLPGVLARFRQTHPDVEVLVHATVWERASDEIADLTISIHRDDEVPTGFRQLWPERLMLVCAAPLADRVTTPQDLMHLPQIVISGRQENTAVMAQALGVSSFETHQLLRTNASNVALELAANGLGLTISLASLARVYLARGLVVEPFPLRPPSPWSYYLHHPAARPSSAARALTSAVLTHGSDGE